MSTRNTHGCCADKACGDKTCMELPSGKTCGDCRNLRHCTAFYGHAPTDTYCDFFPRRFVERTAIAKATGASSACSSDRRALVYAATEVKSEAP